MVCRGFGQSHQGHFLLLGIKKSKRRKEKSEMEAKRLPEESMPYKDIRAVRATNHSDSPLEDVSSFSFRRVETMGFEPTYLPHFVGAVPIQLTPPESPAGFEPTTTVFSKTGLCL